MPVFEICFLHTFLRLPPLSIATAKPAKPSCPACVPHGLISRRPSQEIPLQNFCAVQGRGARGSSNRSPCRRTTRYSSLISSARLSTATLASFCQPPRLMSSAPSPALGAGDAPSRSKDSHVGAQQPCMRSACAACSAATAFGGVACTSPQRKCRIKCSLTHRGGVRRDLRGLAVWALT